ncbi:FkbM family methyltransferase, partial [Candidatus Kaiserbacteria bacterium]|nr:FkbM family methyltransferase [Candidatus Kaiserbacteria bacterium]
VELKRGNKKLLFPRNQMFFFWESVADFDEYFTAFETEMRDGVMVLDFSHTREHVIKFLGVPLLIPGMTEGDWVLKGYTQKYLPKAGDVVFDCGAYCGVMTYYLSQLVGPTGKVYSFEPDPANYAVLLKNIEKHRLHNVVPVNRGLYSHSATLSFNSTSSANSMLARPNTPNTTEVLVVSLADAYEHFKLERLDFVKMDIEGAELEVLQGAKEFLKDKNVHFAIASYHLRDGKQTCEALEKMFAEIGYQAETGFPRHLTTWASRA